MKWEYMTLVIKADGSHVFEMNHLGQDGWELVQVVIVDVSSPLAFFKRRVNE